MNTPTTLNYVHTVRHADSNYASRIEFLLRSRGCTKCWLAKELGISRQALNHVLKHGKKPKFISEIALTFNVNPRWLETGKGKIYLKSDVLLQHIPLYALPELLAANTLTDVARIDKIVFHKENEHHCFAALLNDYPSMSPKFENNTILIFDPLVTPENGSYVLASPKNADTVFRQFFREHNTVVLKPSDSDYESFKCTQNDILATLIETRITF